MRAGFPRRTALAALALGALASCRSAPVHRFVLDSEPPAAQFVTSWGESGTCPAELSPPVRVGRLWFELSAPGFHTQRVRFAFEDRRAREPFEERRQRRSASDLGASVPAKEVDLVRDLSLPFGYLKVTLESATTAPVFVLDLEGGATDVPRVEQR
jgi:hypothetical protein